MDHARRHQTQRKSDNKVSNLPLGMTSAHTAIRMTSLPIIDSKASALAGLFGVLGQKFRISHSKKGHGGSQKGHWVFLMCVFVCI
jgi:hypothetical protein